MGNSRASLRMGMDYSGFDHGLPRTSGSPRLWIALTRPDNLIAALAAAAVARAHFAGSCLIYEESPWWRKAKCEDYRSCFDEIHAVDEVPTCRGLADIARLYRALRGRQEKLYSLGIAQNDTLLLLAGITSLSNAIASVYPDVYKVLCITAQKYRDASRSFSFRHYRHTTSGWLQNHFLESRVGLHRTLHLKPWRGHGDGIRIKRLVEPLENVFEAILLLSNDGREGPAEAKISRARFPSLTEVGDVTANETSRSASKVIFFGTPFLLVRNLPVETYIARLNECLDYLRRSYPPPYQLVYRPHPAETREHEKLKLDRFALERDGQVAEIYFLRHAAQIAAVFSVSSTVSRVALNCGLNAYAFWRCFPFKPAAALYFENLMAAVPAQFQLRSLDQPPQPYHSNNDATLASPSFSEAFAAIAQSPRLKAALT